MGRRPCEGRKPKIPQKLAGVRTEPPVSDPRAKSTRPAATAAAEPAEDSARDASRCRDIDRRSVVFVLAGQAHDEFCRDGRPDERGACVEKFLHHRRRLCCWLVSGQPIGVAATCNATGDIEDILGGECQACERPSAGTRQSDPIMSTERADAVGLDWVHDFFLVYSGNSGAGFRKEQ